jgi:cytochrome c oxidase subunit 4
MTSRAHGHQPLPVRTCVAIYLVLLALTAVTVGAAYLDLSFFNTPIALTIASAKALLVMLFFMELRHSPRLTWIFIGNGIFWLVVMISATISDVISRGWLGVPGK